MKTLKTIILREHTLVCFLGAYFSMLPEDDRMIETCRIVLSVLM